jgi:hypothetical protein
MAGLCDRFPNIRYRSGNRNSVRIVEVTTVPMTAVARTGSQALLRRVAHGLADVEAVAVEVTSRREENLTVQHRDG